jgi:S-adenosylmethionine synthetase
VFGFACRHTPEMMPMSVALAHRLAHRLTACRDSAEFAWLHPDGLAQVAIAYEDRAPVAVEGITLFAALRPGAPKAADIAPRLREGVIDPVLAAAGIPAAPRCRININPADSPGLGGPGQHAGLTGRKNDIDCYGGYSRHGGAALSGKDPSRIDRAAAYAARYAAKNVVASGLAAECEVQLSYAIGDPAPVSVALDCFNTEQVPEERILAALNRTVSFDAQAILEDFKLMELPKRHAGSFFQRLAAFGHFGRTDLHVPWEAVDKAEEIARLAG